jgi:hypothetical protein
LGAPLDRLLCCRPNLPGHIHMTVVRETPCCRSEIGGEEQTCDNEKRKSEPAHFFDPGVNPPGSI